MLPRAVNIKFETATFAVAPISAAPITYPTDCPSILSCSESPALALLGISTRITVPSLCSSDVTPPPEFSGMELIVGAAVATVSIVIARPVL